MPGATLGKRTVDMNKAASYYEGRGKGEYLGGTVGRERGRRVFTWGQS